MNLVLGLLVLGASSVAVWAGIADPEGGVLVGLRNVIAGQENTKHVSATAAAFVSDLATISSVAASSSYDDRGAGRQAPAARHPSTSAAPAPRPGTSAGLDSLPSAAKGRTRQAVVSIARSWLGVPYRWGGNTRKGVDCSGLTKAVFSQVGITLPRVSAAQATRGRRVKVANAQAGDLVFFGVPVHHVAIYIGGGQTIHSPRPGKSVRVESLDSLRKSMPGSPMQVRNVIGKAKSEEVGLDGLHADGTKPNQSTGTGMAT